MKRLLFTLLAVMVVLPSAIAQHSLDSLYIGVYLHRDGSADVYEHRYMYIGDEGTECYIKMYNLGDMDVTDFSVREDSTYYTNEGAWNVDRTRSEKAFRCGINETYEGKELCWGVGSSGNHVYIVQYKLHGLVKSYNDFDGFNFCFYEASTPAADQARIVIRLERSDFTWIRPQFGDSLYNYSLMKDSFAYNLRRDSVTLLHKDIANDTPITVPADDARLVTDSLTRDSTSIWAFGFHGFITFSDRGGVIAETEEVGLEDGERMILMLRFKKGLFAPEINYPDKSFETDVKELAFNGSDYSYDDEGDGSVASLFGGDDTPEWVDTLLLVLGGICCGGVPIILLFWAIFGTMISRKRERKQIKKLIGDAPAYYQEPPLGGNLIRSRRVLRALEPSADKSEMKLVEAYVLRLVDNKLINVVQEMNSQGEIESYFRIEDPEKVEQTIINKDEDHDLMIRLLHLLYQAAGEDHLLQPKELKQMVEDDPLAVRSFARKLRDLNDVQLRPKQVKQVEAQQVYGFWKYLKDFTLVKERALQEVALWKEYLTFATLFGIADQVRADMKKIAPDLQVFDELTRHIIDNTSVNAALYSALTQSIIDAATRTIHYETDYERESRLQRERAARRQRWSGGGGRASFGGGGGFSGGGGSGVR